MDSTRHFRSHFLFLMGTILFSANCEAVIWEKKHNNAQLAKNINSIFKIIQNKKDPEMAPYKKSLSELLDKNIELILYLPPIPPKKATTNSIEKSLFILYHLIKMYGHPLHHNQKKVHRFIYRPYLPKNHALTRGIKKVAHQLENATKPGKNYEYFSEKLLRLVSNETTEEFE